MRDFLKKFQSLNEKEYVLIFEEEGDIGAEENQTTYTPINYQITQNEDYSSDSEEEEEEEPEPTPEEIKQSIADQQARQADVVSRAGSAAQFTFDPKQLVGGEGQNVPLNVMGAVDDYKLTPEEFSELYGFEIDRGDARIDINESVDCMCHARKLMKRSDDIGVFARRYYSEIKEFEPKIAHNKATNLYYPLDRFYSSPMPTNGFKSKDNALNGWRLWVIYNMVGLKFPKERLPRAKNEPDVIVNF